eukprot:2850669-Pleurochrysis_carterae.AAC.1
MRGTSLRALASLAASLGMKMRRWDFVAAYLQGDLEPGEVVYCHPPPGYATIGADGRPRICRVQKPVHGMAQAGRRWQRTLFPWLEEQGFQQSSTDTCTFSKTRDDDKLVLGCYVDDLFILYFTDADGSLYSEFSTALVDRWRVEDESEVSDLPNVDITVEGDDVVLRQSSYVQQLLSTHAPQGIPVSFQLNHAPAKPDLPALIEDAVST